MPLNDDKQTYTEMGYFGSSSSVSDIRVLADGDEVKQPEKMNLKMNPKKKCKIEVRHVKANGKTKKDGVTRSTTFHDELLHLRDLYGRDMHLDPSKFDCVIRFESGHFSGALLKPRLFKEHKKQADGRYEFPPDGKTKMIKKPIAHNVWVQFKLKRGEAIELARDGEVFWSSKDSGAQFRLDIEIIADNTTTQKFYRVALQEDQDSYWLPNQGDPPPSCPNPPCRPGST
jgi:hypothetical protein